MRKHQRRSERFGRRLGKTWQIALGFAIRDEVALVGVMAPRRRERIDGDRTDIFLPGSGKCSMFVLMTESSNPSSAQTIAGPPSRPRGSLPRRRATRLEKAEREQRVVSLLNSGVSVPEIAAQEGLSLKRMRNVVREILSERMPQPSAEFLALQVSRLNEALLVSYSAMHTTAAGTDFEAVDRVVRIVRELDRYHGFAAIPRPREELEARRLPPPVERPLALEGPSPSDSQITLQVLDKARFGLANSRR
jgi:hypothetical protein